MSQNGSQVKITKANLKLESGPFRWRSSKRVESIQANRPKAVGSNWETNLTKSTWVNQVDSCKGVWSYSGKITQLPQEYSHKMTWVSQVYFSEGVYSGRCIPAKGLIQLSILAWRVLQQSGVFSWGGLIQLGGFMKKCLDLFKKNHLILYGIFAWRDSSSLSGFMWWSPKLVEQVRLKWLNKIQEGCTKGSEVLHLKEPYQGGLSHLNQSKMDKGSSWN